MDLVTKLAAAVKKELKRQAEDNGPAGLPKPRANVDITDADYPTGHNQPKDMGFTGHTIIAGTGSGAALGEENQSDSA